MTLYIFNISFKKKEQEIEVQNNRLANSNEQLKDSITSIQRLKNELDQTKTEIENYKKLVKIYFIILYTNKFILKQVEYEERIQELKTEKKTLFQSQQDELNKLEATIRENNVLFNQKVI